MDGSTHKDGCHDPGNCGSGIHLYPAQFVMNGQVLITGRNIMISSGNSFFRAKTFASPLFSPAKGLWAGYLMNEMTVNIDHTGGIVYIATTWASQILSIIVFPAKIVNI
jgi:hypothetical protein